MVLVLKDVFSAARAAELRGKLCSHGDHDDVRGAVISALREHPLFLLGVQPHRFSQVRFSCVGRVEGEPAYVCDEYSVDDALRADVAVTVLLSDPESYEGGELLIDTGYGAQPYKE